MFYLTRTGSYIVKTTLYRRSRDRAGGSAGNAENAQEGGESPEMTIRRRMNQRRRPEGGEYSENAQEVHGVCVNVRILPEYRPRIRGDRP